MTQNADFSLFNHCFATVIKLETDLNKNGKYLTPVVDEIHNNFQLNVMNAMKFEMSSTVLVQKMTVISVKLADKQYMDMYGFLKKILDRSYRVESPEIIGNLV